MKPDSTSDEDLAPLKDAGWSMSRLGLTKTSQHDAGEPPHKYAPGIWGVTTVSTMVTMEDVADLLRKAIQLERERCAKLCDAMGGAIDPRDPDESRLTANELAAAIRASR